MKVLVNREYIDLSLVSSISQLNRVGTVSHFMGSIGFMYKNNKYQVHNLKEIEHITSFTITYLAGSSNYTVRIDNPRLDLSSVKNAIDKGENWTKVFLEYWEVLREKVQERDKLIEEEYNKLIEMWSNTKPSDIIKFNFE
jgi:hypothetical protein